MSYTDVFGGETIFPSQLSFLLLTTSVSATLQWPTEQQASGGNVVADFLNVNATAGSVILSMPSALSTSTGNKTTINNVGANAFDVRDSIGGTIQTIQPGQAWVVVLTSNATAAGTWTTFQLGASVSVASAAALAGDGIKAIGATLNQKIDSSVKAATPFTAVSGDRAKCLIYTAGAGTANLTAAGTLASDWFVMLRNSGTGTLNVLPPAGTIDGSASINLAPGDSCFIFTDGVNFFTVGLSSGSTIAFDFVSIPVPGSGDFTLSGANLNRISYRFTGLLTGNRRIVVPNTTQQYWIANATTGAFTLTLSTVAQVGPPSITQNQTVILYCDSIDVINATSSSAVVFPITIGQGGTGGITIGAAQTNLQVPPVGRLINTTAPLAGGGDLSADRTLTVGAASEAASGVAEIATQAETNTGTDDVRIVTPLKLKQKSFMKAIQSLSFDFTNIGADTTITDLTLPLKAGVSYEIECQLVLTSTTGGWILKVDPPASGVFCYGFSIRESTASHTQIITNGGVVTLSTQASGGTQQSAFTISFFYVPTADGDVLFTIRQQTADLNSSSVLGGSWSRATVL